MNHRATYLLGILLTFAALLVAPSAFAGGNFSIKTTSVTENSSGEWHIKVRIDLSRAPSMMHVPMRFTFSKEAVDERAIVEKGAEPVHHRQVLDTAAKQIQSMDVDFADPSGNVFKSTYFEFDVRRKDGFFEAGDYTVQLTGPDGAIGGAQKVTLKGDNPPVYRGSMDFSDTKKDNKDKKKATNGPNMTSVDGDEKNKSAQGGDENGGATAANKNGDVEAVGNGGSMIPDTAFNKTAEEEGVKDHPAGCGCVAAGMNGGPSGFAGGALAILGLGLVVVRSRRRAA